MGLARELAQRIAVMRYSDLPDEAVYWSKVAVLDTLGVALAGTQEDAFRVLDAAVEAQTGGPSLVVGSRRRVAALDAALLNGTAAHALDFDNTVAALGGHVSAVVVPALIAAGESNESSGADLLLAHVVGIETARLGLALNPDHSEKGWHPTSTLGVFTVAAACARLLHLDVQQTETALALSASLAAGLKANFGTMAKPLHAGQCARGGLMAALLARKGFTANPDVFEHKQGFLELFSVNGRRDTAAVLEGWGEPLSIVSPGASYKVYPCCYATHSAIEGALKLVRGHRPFDPTHIERVECRTSARALAHTNRPRPETNLEAKFSVQYCVARALLDGKVVLEHFEGEAYGDRAVRSLLERLQASVYEGPFYSEDRFDARLKVVLRDGRVLEASVDEPAGRTNAHPISREALDGKFIDCAHRALGPQAAEAVRARIWSLEAAPVRDLTAQLEHSAAHMEPSARAAA